jgi:gliding motility-associated-like protein
VEWNIEHDNVAFPSIYERDVIGYKFDEAGSYLIKLVVYNSEDDCSREYESRFVISDSELYIPNTFTPNGDGQNDEFRVAYRSIASFECKIYNQWERLVYESEDITEGWDGKIDGRDASPGVYFYIIEAKGIDGQNFDKKGSLNLIRVKE